MPITITPEVGIPLPTDATKREVHTFRERAKAMFASLEIFAQEGLEVPIHEEDKVSARDMFTTQNMAYLNKASTGAIVHLESLLDEWDQEVLNVGRRLRNYVTNKLICESVDVDAKVRLKALELLGKISSVDLFRENVNVNVNNRTVKDIESELKKTLDLFCKEVEDVTDTVHTTPFNDLGINPPIAVTTIDVGAELGL